MHKASKWARQIISLQEEDGKWGYFHSLSADQSSPYTTEKALRRLEILGYTMEDECIRKAVAYMNDCLTGVKEIPDRREKLHDWNIFTSLLLAAWIRRFTQDNDAANEVAGKWAKIVTTAFENGEYNHQAYINAYYEIMGMKPGGGRLIDFAQFYSVSVMNGCLDPRTEERMLGYIIHSQGGIYYIYEKCIMELPRKFDSRQASRYLGSIELLAEYETAKNQLQFVADWLEENRNANGKWDMGKSAKDGIYFPLSNDWRKAETREADCTERVVRLLGRIAL